MISEQYAKRFCKDDISKIENYDKAIADTTQVWDIHHRLEITLDGQFAHSTEDLKRLGMYRHRPYFELIFLTHAEHTQLHKKGNQYSKDIHHSDETKRRISIANKGENNPFYGKHHSAETRKKMSETRKGRPFTEEHKRRMSESAKARLARQRFEENLTV